MTICDNGLAEGPDMSKARLQLVPPLEPEPVILPYRSENFSDGQVAIAIGELATHIKENYQNAMGVGNADEYITRRQQKRRRAAYMIFHRFGMLHGAVETDEMSVRTEGSVDPTNESLEKDFGEVYDRAEDQAIEMAATDRASLVGIVETYYEHPVIRAALAVRRTTGEALADDVITMQRAAALIIDRYQPAD